MSGAKFLLFFSIWLFVSPFHRIVMCLQQVDQVQAEQKKRSNHALVLVLKGAFQDELVGASHLYILAFQTNYIAVLFYHLHVVWSPEHGCANISFLQTSVTEWWHPVVFKVHTTTGSWTYLEAILYLSSLKEKYTMVVIWWNMFILATLFSRVFLRRTTKNEEQITLCWAFTPPIQDFSIIIALFSRPWGSYNFLEFLHLLDASKITPLTYFHTD